MLGNKDMSDTRMLVIFFLFISYCFVSKVDTILLRFIDQNIHISGCRHTYSPCKYSPLTASNYRHQLDKSSI